jgi:hypothetical protein
MSAIKTFIDAWDWLSGATQFPYLIGTAFFLAIFFFSLLTGRISVRTMNQGIWSSQTDFFVQVAFIVIGLIFVWILHGRFP